jgi:hypothetical protein
MVAQTVTQGTAMGMAPVLTTNATLIGKVVAVDGAPELSRNAIKTTYSLSTGGWDTYIKGDILNGGQISITCQYDTQLDYKTLFAAGCDTITITFPLRATSCGGSVASVAASIAMPVVFLKISPKWPFDDLMVVTLLFQVAGAPTYTAATA